MDAKHESNTGQTWLDPESYAYHSKWGRQGRVMYQGKVRACRAGVADTFFSVPAKVGGVVGFVVIGDDGEFEFTPDAN